MKKGWRNLIVGLAVLVIGGVILSKIDAIWKITIQFVSGLLRTLATPVSLPLWLAILLGLVGLLAIAACIVTFWVAYSDAISFRDYRQDKFFDVIWRWHYTKDGQPAYDIWCYCPKCDTILVYETNYVGYPVRPQLVLSCETCHNIVTVQDGDKNELTARVIRQIDRKIRTGEWKQESKSKTLKSVG